MEIINIFQHLSPEAILNPSLWNDQNQNCWNDVLKISDGLKNFDLWSYQILDASTKIPSGILTGNIVDLGNFDECISSEFKNSTTRGQFCLASVPFRPENLSLPVFPTLTLSYCIPSSCNATFLENVLNTAWRNVTKASAKVNQNDCQISEETAFSTVDIFSISFFSFFLFLCVASTIYDVSKTYKGLKPNQLLKSFSLYTNGKRLIDTKKNAEALSLFNGLKFLSMLWIILGHRYFFMVSFPLINLIDITRFRENASYQIIANALMAVDTFFLLSGFLNVYNMMKKLDATKKFPVFKYYIHRYLRTTPALAAVVFIYSTWFAHVGNGPLWKRTSGPWKELCVDYWWSTLLYINNYYNPVAQCTGQSWYLAVDMQLYWLAPLVVLPCWKWPKITKYYLGILLLASTSVTFAVAYIKKIRKASAVSDDFDEYLRVTEEMYVPTHTRATPYIIGLTLGFFLYGFRKSNRMLSMKSWMVAMGWILSITICLAVIFGNFPLFETEAAHPYDRLESSFYISLHRIGWGLGLSWIIFACVQGYGGPVNSFLSWPVFAPLSRLTYCMFLTQLAVQQYFFGTIRTASYYRDIDQIHGYFGDLFFITICSAVISLMFESPVMMIEKYFMTPRRKADNPEVRKMEGIDNKSYVK